MVKGISLHIEINSVDPAHYGGWAGTLAACEADAKDMQALARARGCQPTVLLTKEATHRNVVGALGAAARALGPGDLFMLTYSGHGGQVPDSNGDEPDGRDETWVLYDRQLVDDELYALWGRFQPGVRVVMLSDSCHSGSVARKMQYEAILSSGIGAEDPATPPAGEPPRMRMLPGDVRDATYARNQALYDGVQREYPDGERAQIGASVILISGCQDNQLSADGDRNGLFTATLLKVWNNGAYRAGYRRFHRSIVRRMPLYQSPNYFTVGAPNPAFETQPPFTL